MLNIDLVGYLAGFIVAISLLPQVIKAWKTKSTRDISLVWNSLYIIGLIFWIVYGFGISSLPIMVAVSIETTLAFSLIIAKIKYR